MKKWLLLFLGYISCETKWGQWEYTSEEIKQGAACWGDECHSGNPEF